jgi:hypothetical protein
MARPLHDGRQRRAQCAITSACYRAVDPARASPGPDSVRFVELEFSGDRRDTSPSPDHRDADIVSLLGVGV